ncbi:elongation factor-like GTPase 1 isoform X2 [Nematostella vectensis]|uniref:elongation factor-like GTPase 1 isoform X2 n=1 Tax=Nematostella vectensis TaxID=45351 RepID=UPI0020773326|nr:elongation factor-like GTPase 1 isoform X2 [Nematostella vectensis]
MRATTVEHLSELQKKPQNIRNICILAHVDHGKTTLADALVASNGIISSRLAGKLRYMDSLEEEQVRGITMKSSAISLHFKQDEDEYLINLIDSPGHVDFSSEVSTAVRLCDGALVVVDVVEGVSPQTHVVLRQAWLENIRPCLVLNKIDRLITELKYSPSEAYIHLQQILEQVNAITGTLFSSHVMEKSCDSSETRQVMEDPDAVSIDDWSSGLEATDDSNLYFSPDLGNVVFSSAIDGWGFSIKDFANLYSKKLGLKAEILQKTLWGDFYLDSKTKRIFKKAQLKNKKPLFVQFILDNIWALYDAVVIRRDKIKSEQISNSLKLKISVRDSRSSDPRVYLHAICSQWLPLSSALLSMVVDKLPSPLEIPGERVDKLMCSGLRTFESLPPETRRLKEDFIACSSTKSAPIIVFVSKMFAVDDNALPKHRRRPLTQEDIAQRREQARLKHAERMEDALQNAQITPQNDAMQTKSTAELDSGTPLQSGSTSNSAEDDKERNKTHFMAFARVYSGTISRGQQLYILGPKHDPRDMDEDEVLPSNTDSEGLQVSSSVDLGTTRHVAVFTVSDLYLLMGRELEAVDSVPAGNVLGIGGLQHYVLKSATISSTRSCPPFTALTLAAVPIVRVAVEPVHAADMPALSRGMRLLNQADPCVETLVQSTGEHVIIAAGEVHLQRCVDDLKRRYACVELNVSDPIIPFRETVIPPPRVDMVNEAITGDSRLATSSDPTKEKHLVVIQTANKQCTIHIRASPLPQRVITLLDESADLIKLLTTSNADRNQSNANIIGSEKRTSGLKPSVRKQLSAFYSALQEAFREAGKQWANAADHIWAFGPRGTGPNILLNRDPDYPRPSIWQCLDENGYKAGEYKPYDSSIVSGFQMTTLSGPLCAEPLMGVCFSIEHLVLNTGQSSLTGFIEERRDIQFDQSAKLPNISSPAGRCGMEGDAATDTYNTIDVIQSPAEAISDIKNDCTAKVTQHNRDEVIEKTKSDVVNDDITVSPVNQGGRPVNKDSSDFEYSEAMKPEVTQSDRHGPLSGQLMSAVKEGCRRAFQQQPMRLMAAMYTCHIQATAEVLGRMYAVIARREGRVLSEEMKEGSDVFDVEAVLPVAESFGFSEEIRKRTSGLANPQLMFSHWEAIDLDPYWVPSTEEEYMHFGEKADSENRARKYMNSIRRRKGLYVEEKTVEHAEKQRTLKK